jgi:hypothetical protein
MFSQVPSYRQLEAPHAQVHQNIQEAVKLLESGWWDRNPETQAQIFTHFEAAEGASEEVVQVLDRMVEERHRTM